MSQRSPEMFRVIISVLEHVQMRRLAYPHDVGKRKALQHLFLSALLVPQFDAVHVFAERK